MKPKPKRSRKEIFPSTINHQPSTSDGFTLIEIMIVIAMIAGIMAIGATVIFPPDDSKVRSAASTLAGTIQFVYNEAATKNRYYRMVFDFETRQYHVESNTEPFYISMEGEESETKPKSKSEDAEIIDEDETINEFVEETEGPFKLIKLKGGVKFKDILVLHAKDKKESGVIEAYFLPNGWAEPMVINLSDEEEDVFYSIEVNPLTGKSKIRGEYLESNPEALKGEEVE